MLSRLKINRYTSSIKNLEKTIHNIKLNKQIPIIDYANENSKYPIKNYNIIKKTIKENPYNTFAIKFSSLGIYNDNNKCFELADKLINTALDYKSTIMIDAEYDCIQSKINTMTDELIEKYNKQKCIVYKTYQMYRNDSMNNLTKDLYKFNNLYHGIKLVRGAYYNSDYKTGNLHTIKQDTDNDFNEVIKLFNINNNKKHKMVVASHNHESINLVKNLNHNSISVAHLLGFSDKLSKELVQQDIIVYKYLPFGNYNDTFPYLIRRLYENYPILMHLNK